MTKTTRSLLDQSKYRNPRYEQEAAELEALEKEAANPQAQEDGDAPEGKKQEPNHNYEKRYKDLQSWSSKEINKLKQQVSTLEQQGVPSVEVPKTQEELVAFQEKNPELYNVIQVLAQQKAEERMQQHDAVLAEVSGNLEQERKDKAEQRLRELHPDVEQIASSNEFADWSQRQSDEVQGWINSVDNADLVSRALSLFKYEVGIVAKQENSQQPSQGGDMHVGVRKQTQAPEGTDRNHPAYIWKESEINGMSMDEFAKWEEVISLSHREGRIAIGQ